LRYCLPKPQTEGQSLAFLGKNLDQAASSDQTILRYLGKRGQDTNLDRMSVYVLVAIVRKKLNLDVSLYTLLQVLSLTLFEKTPLQQAFPGGEYSSESTEFSNQLSIFNI
jgi:hypothetical protein